VIKFSSGDRVTDAGDLLIFQKVNRATGYICMGRIAYSNFDIFRKLIGQVIG
jgi:hypothetical protein